MSRRPIGIERLLRTLAPAEFRDDLLHEVEARWAQRRAEAGRIGATRWLVRELAITPWLSMWRQAWRMRARGTRRHEHVTKGGWEMSSVLAGIRIAIRSLRARPAFTAAAVLTLIASVGAATLVFSVLEGVILRPLPYPDADRLYRVHGTNEEWRESTDDFMRGSWESIGVTSGMVDAWRASAADVDAVAAYLGREPDWEDGLTPPIRARGAYVLPGFFEAFELEPVIGRYPTEAELASGAPVLVIGERLWTSRYGADPDALSRSITLSDRSYEIIGVAPSALGVPDETAAWWTPLPPDYGDGRTDNAVFTAVARLGRGVSPAAADVQLDELVARLSESDPAYQSLGARLEPLRDVVTADVSEGITLLFASVTLIVLIASVNLANLVLVRVNQRRSELAMRAALGASRGDLVWALISETLVLCAVGGGLGVIVATQLTPAFVDFLSSAIPDFPRADNVGLNPLVLLFALAVTSLTVLLAGLLPGLAASRRSPWDALRGSRRNSASLRTRQTQRGLLFAEAVMAMLLLGTAGLFTRSALHVFHIDPGFGHEAVAYVEVRVTPDRYPDETSVASLVGQLEERLQAIPGVTSVGAAMAAPGMGGAELTTMRGDRQAPDQTVLKGFNEVTPGYFTALDIPLVRGRYFDDGDVADAESVVILSELLAVELFGADDPLGQTVHIGRGAHFSGGRVVSESEYPATVVGVVGDVRQLAIVQEADALLYHPLAQSTPAEPTLFLRADGRPEEVLGAARAAVQEVDAGLGIGAANGLRPGMQRLLAPLWVRTGLIIALAVLACFLTLVGIYGVVAYVVSDQLREIGLRMALGARAGGEESRVVLHALRPVLLGSLVGLGGAWVTQQFVESDLFGINAFDLPTYAVVLLALAGVSALAAWWPARRAAAVDPARVLSE